MDAAALVQELSSLPLYELYRVRHALDQMLDDPVKNQQVKNNLRPGMAIRYFDDSGNRLVEATILELRRTRLLVENLEDRRRWQIHYFSVNLEGTVFDVVSPAGTSDRSAWKVGAAVCFKDRQNCDIYGTIVSLNPRTATVITKANQKWRVGYVHLLPVWEGETQAHMRPSQQALPMGEKTLRVIEECDPEEGPGPP
jgi:hypothetical protein